MIEKVKNILVLLLYFVVAILFLSSIGIWLPVAIDSYNQGHVSIETMSSLSGNILTYSLSIFLIAAIDRILHLFFKTSSYSNNSIEFLFIIILVFATGYVVFSSLRALKNAQIDDAIDYAKYVTFIAWGVWIYVKLQGSRANNFSSIGGVL
jgi:hypothetical protein